MSILTLSQALGPGLARGVLDARLRSPFAIVPGVTRAPRLAPREMTARQLPVREARLEPSPGESS